MGCWGMGLNQSDEYCEVYESFMERYDEGMAAAEIREEILSDYLKEFNKDDPILHDVYFALAKAGWMCCDQSPEILARVKAIIESGANLEFYRELGADDRDLALRQKKLGAFWDSLQSPRARPRKRRPAPRERELPDLDAGDVLSYKAPQGQRVLVVLDRIGWPRFFEDQLFCCILQRTFQQEALRTLDPLKETLGLISSFTGQEFLARSSYRKIGHIAVPDSLYGKLYPMSWNGQILFLESGKKDFQAAFSPEEELELGQLLTGKTPEGMSLYGKVSRVSFRGGGVRQSYIKTEPRKETVKKAVNRFRTEEIDRVLSQVGVNESEDFYRALDSVVYSLGRDAENTEEAVYAYRLLMELSQHPKAQVRQAVIGALGTMAARNKKAPLSEKELTALIQREWSEADAVGKGILTDAMEDLRQSRGWQIALPEEKA